MDDLGHAQVRVWRNAGQSMVLRVAVFAFDAPDGFIWIEPNFIAKPPHTSPFGHRYKGKLEVFDVAAVVESDSGGAQLLPASNPDVLYDLAAFDKWAADHGHSMKDLRERARREAAELL